MSSHISSHAVQIIKAGAPDAYGNSISLAEIERVAKETAEVYGCLSADRTALGNVAMSKVTHVASAFKVENGTLWCIIKILDNPQGHALQQLIDAGVYVYFDAIGLGDVDTIKHEVTNYELIGIDARIVDMRGRRVGDLVELVHDVQVDTVDFDMKMSTITLQKGWKAFVRPSDMATDLLKTDFGIDIGTFYLPPESFA